MNTNFIMGLIIGASVFAIPILLKVLIVLLRDIKTNHEQTISWSEIIHPDSEALEKRDTFLSDENGEKLKATLDESFK